MTVRTFDGDFTQQHELPTESIRLANEVLSTAKLHRYNVSAGEESHAALLEKEYAKYQGREYCLALTSCGQALQIALRAMGVKANDTVLTNAFTLAPVPGAIAALSAQSVFIETTADLVLDLADLEEKARLYKGSVFLLSHMRGHLSDMDALSAIAQRYALRVVEDCAHTMGARWNKTLSGNFGTIGCFSTQTYKHMNSGEGGFLVTDDPAIMARAIFLSGSYMLNTLHGTVPDTHYFDEVQPYTPNLSARLDNVRAALLRPQLPLLNQWVEAWNERYAIIHHELEGIEGVYLPKRFEQETYVGSSFQFLLPDWSADKCATLVTQCADRGVVIKWFGAKEPKGYTSTYRNWQYASQHDLRQTDSVLAGLFDIRIPLSFSLDDCYLIGEIISEEIIKLA